jgi:hypothetical protein
MALFSIRVEVDFTDRVYDLLVRIANALESQKPSYQVRINFMPFPIKADYPDFDVAITLNDVDSEGNQIPGSGSLPAGFTLTVASDNEAAFSVTQDAANPLLVHCHVGTPEADGTPAAANFSATLTDASGALVAADTKAIVVTAGDPAAILGITMNLPTDIVET